MADKLTRRRFSTIGLILNAPIRAYQENLIRGAEGYAIENGHRLITYIGDLIESEGDALKPANAVYELAGREALDGVIVASGAIGLGLSRAELGDFFSSFKPLPLVSIEVELDEYQSVGIDNYKAMRRMVEHMLDKHGYRKLGFFCKNPGSLVGQERFRAYREALQSRGIEYEENLVVPGEYYDTRLAEGLSLLFDERGLSPGRDIQAIVFVDDYSAMEAQLLLAVRGIRVPVDLAICGFDDNEDFSCQPVSLTTVHQPIYEMGWRAAELLIARISEKDKPLESLAITLESRLAIRRSCGCCETGDDEATGHNEGASPMLPDFSSPASRRLARALEISIGELLTRQNIPMQTSVMRSLSELKELLSQILAADGSPREIARLRGQFRAKVDDICRVAILGGSDMAFEMEALRVFSKALEVWLRPVEAINLKDVMMDSALRVATAMRQSAAYKRMYRNQRDYAFSASLQNLADSRDYEELWNNLAREILRLGIKDIAVAFYDSAKGRPRHYSKLAMVIIAGRRLEGHELSHRFISRCLLPQELWDGLDARSFMVLPLAAKDEVLGYTLIRRDDMPGMGFEALGLQLANAIKVIRLGQMVETHLGQIEAASQVSRALSANLSLDSLMGELASLTAKTIGLDEVRVYLCRGVEGGLEFVASSLGASLLSENNLVDELAQEAAKRSELLRTEMPRGGEKLAIPFFSKEGVLGILEARSSSRLGFSEAELRILSALASQAGITAQNARLFAEAQEARRAAEAASRAKSEFLAYMSHELRTPLNGILGYTQLLMLQEGLDREAVDFAKIIQKSGEHLLILINDTLDMAKIEAGRMELYPSTVYLETFLEDIRDLAMARTTTKSANFSLECIGEMPESVRVDERRLRQVLINLLGNALKFAESGKVCLRVRNIGSHSDAVLATRLRFEVEDDGPGIKEAELTRIFSPYEQVGERAMRWRGSGLGLAISRSLVEAMGGVLEVRSEYGKGSIFYFELELAIGQSRSETGENEDIAVTGFKGGPKVALVVDDVANNRSLLVSFLKDLGFTVEEAIDGQIALEKAKKLLPDLIIMDVVMPRMDGIEAAKALRSQGLSKRPYIIALSASTMDGEGVKAKEVGCDVFMAKPVILRQLVREIERGLKLEWTIRKEPTLRQTKSMARGQKHRAAQVKPNQVPREKLLNAKEGEFAAIDSEFLAQLRVLAGKRRFLGLQKKIEETRAKDASLYKRLAELLSAAKAFDQVACLRAIEAIYSEGTSIPKAD